MKKKIKKVTKSKNFLLKRKFAKEEVRESLFIKDFSYWLDQDSLPEAHAFLVLL